MSSFDWTFVAWIALSAGFMIPLGVYATCEAILKVRKTYREWGD